MPKWKIDTTPKIIEAVKKIYKQKLEGKNSSHRKNIDLVFTNRVNLQISNSLMMFLFQEEHLPKQLVDAKKPKKSTEEFIKRSKKS